MMTTGDLIALGLTAGVLALVATTRRVGVPAGAAGSAAAPGAATHPTLFTSQTPAGSPRIVRCSPRWEYCPLRFEPRTASDSVMPDTTEFVVLETAQGEVLRSNPSGLWLRVREHDLLVRRTPLEGWISAHLVEDLSNVQGDG